MQTDKAEPFGGAGVDERGRTVAFPDRDYQRAGVEKAELLTCR